MTGRASISPTASRIFEPGVRGYAGVSGDPPGCRPRAGPGPALGPGGRGGRRGAPERRRGELSGTHPPGPRPLNLAEHARVPERVAARLRVDAEAVRAVADRDPREQLPVSRADRVDLARCSGRRARAPCRRPRRRPCRGCRRPGSATCATDLALGEGDHRDRALVAVRDVEVARVAAGVEAVRAGAGGDEADPAEAAGRRSSRRRPTSCRRRRRRARPARASRPAASRPGRAGASRRPSRCATSTSIILAAELAARDAGSGRSP